VRNGATISAVDEAVGKPERRMTLPCNVPIVDFPIVLAASASIFRVDCSERTSPPRTVKLARKVAAPSDLCRRTRQQVRHPERKTQRKQSQIFSNGAVERSANFGSKRALS
jgi:hypothetical protein